MKILNFNNTSILFLLLFALFMVCNIPWFVYPGLLLLYLGFTVSMAFFPASGFHYSKVKTHGDRAGKFLTLTFDDGPDAVITPKVLDLLGKHNITAAFFIIGMKVNGNEGILKRMVDEGRVLSYGE